MIVSKNMLAAVLTAVASIGVSAQGVDTVRVAGPFAVQQPLKVDSVDARQQKLADTYMLDVPIAPAVAKQGKTMAVSELNADSTLRGKLLMAAFTMQLDRYAKTEVKADGPKQKKVFINGKETSGKQGLQRGCYDVVVKYVADTSALSLKVEADSAVAILTPNSSLH